MLLLTVITPCFNTKNMIPDIFTFNVIPLKQGCFFGFYFMHSILEGFQF